MEILQLKYFCDAAKTQNFSVTAKKFMIPPSAVSQSIRRLEKELGFSLFERNANKISLNDEGRIFFDAVMKSAEIFDDAQKQISDTHKKINGEIRLQIFCNRRIVADTIREFKSLYPDVTFKLNHGFLSEEAFDLIISDNIFQDSHLRKVPLVTEDIGVAFAKDHPLAKKDSISVQDLVYEQFITMHKDSRLFRLTMELCQSAGFTPEISIECDDPYYIRKYIEMGIGIGFVPVFSWKGQLSEDIVCKTLEGCARTTYVFWNEERYMSNSVKEFLKMLCSGKDSEKPV